MLKFGIFKVVGYLRIRIKIPKLKTIFKMKKVFAILAIAALTACGGASTEAKTDTAAAATVDTAAAVTVDTAAAATADTAAAAK